MTKLIWESRFRQKTKRSKLEEAFAPLGFTLRLDKPMPPVPDKMLRAIRINPKQVREKFEALG